MNFLPIEPRPNLEDTKRQLPPVDIVPLKSFPPPAISSADITEQVAVERALKIAANRVKVANLKVTKSSLMSYQEACQQLSEPIEEDCLLFNTTVWIIEISGTFKRRNHRRSQEEVLTSTPTFTKAYVVLRAADGLLLITKAIE